MVTPIYPPRPKSKITPGELKKYEDTRAWLAQRKYNGTRNLVFVQGDYVELFTRHASSHKQFKLGKSLKEQILALQLDSDKSYWLDSELLNAKTSSPEYKGKIVLFDVLQAGTYLFGKSQEERLDILSEICHDPQKVEPNRGIALQVFDDVWMSPTFRNGFVKEFKLFEDCDEIEGLVLRKINSTLDNLGKKEYEVPWQIRCRKPHAGGNYHF